MENNREDRVDIKNINKSDSSKREANKEEVEKSRIQKSRSKAGKKRKLKIEKMEKEKQLEKEITRLKEELLEKDEQLCEYVDTLQRLQAEFENFKKRTLKEQNKLVLLANKDLIKELLPVLDNFERAINSYKNGDEVQTIIEGLNIINNQFNQLLNKENLKEIYPEGEMFDPRYHKAVIQIENDQHEEGTILEVLKKGYFLNDSLLRPAVVKVSKKPDKS